MPAEGIVQATNPAPTLDPSFAVGREDRGEVSRFCRALLRAGVARLLARSGCGACEAVPRGKVKPRSAPERGRASLVVGHENPLTLPAPCPPRVTSWGDLFLRAPGEDLLVGRPQLGGYRAITRFETTARRQAQVLLAQLRHEPIPHLGTALLQHPRSHAQLFARREVPSAPRPQMREDRHEGDGLLGEAVDRLLLVARVVPPGYHPLPEELPHAVGQDVGGDALLRTQELAEVALAAEHHVAEDQQTPFVAEHLQREVDRAPRAVIVAFHPQSPETVPKIAVAKLYQSPYAETGCKRQAKGNRWPRRTQCHARPATCRSRSTASSPGRTRAGRIRWGSAAGRSIAGTSATSARTTPTRRQRAGSCDRAGPTSWAATCSGRSAANGMRTGMDGGAPSRPTTRRSSCSPTTPASRSRWRAARASTSSPRASRPHTRRRMRRPARMASTSRAAPRPSVRRSSPE